MTKTTIIFILVLGLIGIGLIYVMRPDQYSDPINDQRVNQIEALVECLAEAGVVIYGSVTCPFCTQLANSFGGYQVIKPIYVECPDEPSRCQQEMQTNGVPEIQIQGQLYQGPREPVAIGQAAGCELE